MQKNLVNPDIALVLWAVLSLVLLMSINCTD